VPYFELSKNEIDFPPAYFADPEGLVASGGDLNPERLLLAYNSGIYYWHYPLKHIKWWSPDPRTVLQLNAFDISFDRFQHLEKQFTVGLTNDFERVLRHCQKFYNNEEKMDNNWLSERAFRAFMELHQKGLAHAVEVWRDRHFVGGIFGVAIGKIFFGEYAFSLEESADEIALLYLIKKLKEKDFQLIDMQKQTMQVSGFELDEMSRTEYVALCKANAEKYATKFRQL
jgi:leucyl/phenylalanyl-tRNA--protein transferase